MEIVIRDGKITDRPAPIPSRKKRPWKLRNPDDLKKLLEELNKEMIEEKVRLTARALTACLKITERFEITLPYEAAETVRRSPNILLPKEVRHYIENYFKWLYGPRAENSFEIGRVAFRLRGDYYALRCPVTFNTVAFVCEPEKFQQDWRPDVCNVVDLILDMTPSLAMSLKAQDVVKLAAALSIGMGAFASLNAIKDLPLVDDALGDIDAAVLHLITNQKHPGQSQWATLQTIEKLLKAFLVTCGQDVPKTHEIQALADLAVAEGLPAPPSNYIEVVHCTAKVRYGQGSVSLRRAEAAHLMSLEMAEVIAQTIGHRLKRKMPQMSEPEFDGVPMEAWLISQGAEIKKSIKLEELS